MKKKIAIFLTVILIISLIPINAFAASVYDVSIWITDKNCSSPERTNKEYTQSASYVAGSTNMVQLVAELIAKCYANGDTSTDFYNFQSAAMKAQMDLGLSIALEKEEHTKSEWPFYVSEMNNTYNQEKYKTLFLNYNANVSDYGPGTIVINHENTFASDQKYGVIYTVTIVITDHVYPYISPVVTGSETINVTNSVSEEKTGAGQTNEIKGGGEITLNKQSANPGDSLTLTAKPDEGKMLKYVDIRDQNGNKVEVTYSGNGKYSFKMPEGGVTVNAVFQAEPALPSETGVSTLLDTDDHRAFMQGDNHGTFRPKADISRCEVAQMFFNLLRNKNLTAEDHFADVPSDYWYAQAVNVLTELGILNGSGEGNFAPTRPITRAEFAAIATRFAKAASGKNNFNDVPDSHWAKDNIVTAAEYGWITGYTDGSFKPNEPITREEAAAIVNRMLYRFGDQIRIDSGDYVDFPDISDNMWSWYEINEACEGHDFGMEDSHFVKENWEDVMEQGLYY